MSWSPAQYLKFSQPRLRPALELLARVDLESPAAVYDLGCGTGEVTRLMAGRWPGAVVTGVDASVDMLEKASGVTANLRWLAQDIETWKPDSAVDLIYSNAALHWLPDHARLITALAASLTPGGILAVQMPRNFAEPSHTAIALTVHEGPWRSRLEPLLVESPVAEPMWYLQLLGTLFPQIDLWQSQYFQILQGDDPVKEWTKGTWLRRFLMALPASERDAFEQAYARRVAAAYPRRADGTTVFPFQRLFFVARRGGQAAAGSAAR
ncbi:MAG TPA: methyltransferase domain-containing protein [Steroidobacteraceae bacterium]